MFIIVALTFIAAFMICGAACFAVLVAKDSPKTTLKKRLQRMAIQPGGAALPEDLRAEIVRDTAPLERFLARFPFVLRVDRLIDHAGMRISAIHFLISAFILFVGGFAVPFFLTKSYLAAGITSIASIVAPFLYLDFLKRKRLEKFTEQLPEVLAMVSRSLRAGHALSGAIQMVGLEMDEPSRELFRTASEQQKLGLRLIDSLTAMADRIDSLDLRFFVTAVTINGEVGGNLAEVLDKLGETIRQRLTIRRQVKVFTAQGRMTGWVLGILPIVAFFLMNTLKPGYEAVLFQEKAGNYMLMFAVAAQIIGVMTIRKIINIRI